MPITINGGGNIQGLSVGGLPDGTVDADTLAANAVTSAKVASAAITSSELHDDAVTTSKLPSGTVVQFLQTHINGSLYWADMTDWTVCTGLTLTITPKASTNKLILRAQVHQAAAESSGNGDFTSCIAFKKAGSLLTYTTYQSWGYGDYHEYVNDNDMSLSSGTGQCERVEVAGTTSATQFDVCIRSGASGWSGNNVYVGRSNRGENGWYNSSNVRSTFSITEVAS